MILQIIAVLDQKAHTFANPFFVAHEDLAKRSFQEAAKSPGNMINKYPADFTLYHLGAFDDASARFDLFPQPRLLFSGAQLELVQPRANPEAIAHVR